MPVVFGLIKMLFSLPKEKSASFFGKAMRSKALGKCIKRRYLVIYFIINAEDILQPVDIGWAKRCKKW